MDLSICRVKSKTIELIFASSPLNRKYEEARAKSGWLRNYDNLSEWIDMPTIELLFEVARTIEIQLIVLV